MSEKEPQQLEMDLHIDYDNPGGLTPTAVVQSDVKIEVTNNE